MFASTLKRLCREGHMDEWLCDSLTPRYSSASQMYGMPKVHKDGNPMRPIVSAIGSLSYKLAKELTRVLTPPGWQHHTGGEEFHIVCGQNP